MSWQTAAACSISGRLGPPPHAVLCPLQRAMLCCAVQALGREVEALKSHCQAVLDSEAHFRAPGRHGGAMARLAVRLLRGFL